MEFMQMTLANSDLRIAEAYSTLVLRTPALGSVSGVLPLPPEESSEREEMVYPLLLTVSAISSGLPETA